MARRGDRGTRGRRPTRAGQGRDRLKSHVLGLARAHASDTDFPEPLVGEPGFDDVLDGACERILEIVGEDGMADFMSGLEAVGIEAPPVAGTTNGKVVAGFAKLFFVPLYGSLGGMGALIGDDASFDAIARSFRANGLVGRDSNVVVSRELLEGRHLIEMGPGALRGVAVAMRDLLSGGDAAAVPGALEREVRRVLPWMAEGGILLQDGVVTVSTRVLVAARMTFVVVDAGDDLPSGPGDFIDDFADPREVEAMLSEEPSNVDVAFGVEEPWSRAMNALGAPHGVAFEPPCDLRGAVSAVACHGVRGPIGILRAREGLAPDAPADVVHVCWHGERIRVLVEHDGVVMGPAEVPGALSGRDVDAFTDAVVGLGGEGSGMVSYDDARDMPRPHRTLQAVGPGR